MQGFIQNFLLREKKLGDILKRFDIGEGARQACLTEIMTSDVQKGSANKFQVSVELLRL